MKNLEIAKILYEIAEMLEIKGVEFKPRAYQRAAQSIESISEDIVDLYKKGGVKELEKIPGVGEHIALKIKELIETGKLKYYEDLKKQMPMNVDELRHVHGMGPKRIKLLYQKLKIKNLRELEKAAKEHKIQKIKGLGAKVEEDILKGIEFAKQGHKRFLLGYIIPIADDIKKKLLRIKGVKKVEIAGSYRRMKESIGDIDILVSALNPKQVMEHFVKMDDVSDVLAHGATKSIVRLNNGLQVDVRVLKENEFGSALQYFTGNKEHNIELRKIALSKGYTLSEYGLFTIKGKKWIAGRTEEEIYKKLGIDIMAPEMRENIGEIEAAKKHALPNLIDYGEAKGDFQMHTIWSDGSNSIEEMVKSAVSLGRKFITITDHVGQLAIAHALDKRRIEKQAKEIEKIRRKYDNSIRIFHGAEVDILKNGRLAMERNLQDKLDVILASIHSAFKMSEKDMTSRILNALDKDRVHIFAHPTGRLINKREGYAVNLAKLFEAAKRTNTFLEINCYPERMDLDGVHVKAAKDVGCLFSIGTDSHNKTHMNFLKLGEAIARRGWLESRHVLNTFPVNRIEKILEGK
ncbi:DNA polymerase/3'-5' exonuclease PolX [Candidatus Pacearchaeota archaeon]|nr:DNA polymerase/3'-5' exonuclease PolX [Candidatus Pacearchaeota archaeon]